MTDDFSWKKRLLMIGVGLGFATFLLWYINFYVFNSRAGQGMIAATWSPATTTVDGAPGTVNLLLESPAGIGGFDIRFATTGGVSVVGTSAPSSLDSTDPFTPIVSEGNRSSYVLISQKAGTLPKTLTVPVTITCTQEGTGTVTIDTSTSEGIGSGTDKLGLQSTNELSVNCMTGSLATLDETLPTGYAAYFNPVLIRASINQAFTYQFTVQANTGDAISGYAAKLKYDPTLIDIVSVGDLVRDTVGSASKGATLTKTPTAPTDTNVGASGSDASHLFDVNAATGDAGVSQLIKKIDAVAGTIELTFVVVQQDEQLPSKLTVPINFKAKKNGAGTIAFTSFESKLKSGGTTQPVTKEGTYIIGEGSTPTGTPPGGGTVTPTGTQGGTGNVILNIRAKLQGVVAQPAVRSILPFRVGIGGGALTEPVYASTQFTVQNDLAWTGTVRFDVPPGADYVVYLKGPNHLQKKLCDAQPVDPGQDEFYACDAGSITLADGANAFDFSGVRLLAGDNPDQDGVINAYDINVCRTSLGKSDTDSQRLCDLNLDGKVNALDHSLVIANLSIKTDDPSL